MGVRLVVFTDIDGKVYHCKFYCKLVELYTADNHGALRLTNFANISAGLEELDELERAELISGLIESSKLLRDMRIA